MDPFTYYFQTPDRGDMNHLRLKIVSTEKIDDDTVTFIGANPPDQRTSFSGSALPFPNEEHAYENTPTHGVVELDAQEYEAVITFLIPNAYYTNMGNTYVNPHLKLVYKQKGIMYERKVDVLDRIPFITLTHPKTRTSPNYYRHHNEVASQESLLRANGYPSQFTFTS